MPNSPELDGIAESNGEMIKIVAEAYDVYVARNIQRGNAWKEADLSDALHHIRSKHMRLEVARKMVENGDRDFIPEDIDDALDLIVYAAFAISHIRAGRYEVADPEPRRSQA